MLFSHRKLEVPVASLAISVVPARTLRLPTAGIGTELLAHREKIEVTRHDSTYMLSPVPVRPAHRPHTRAFCGLPGEGFKSETAWRSGMDSNPQYRLSSL